MNNFAIMIDCVRTFADENNKMKINAGRSEMRIYKVIQSADSCRCKRLETPKILNIAALSGLTLYHFFFAHSEPLRVNHQI